MEHAPDGSQIGLTDCSFETDELLPVVYEELRRMAASRMSQESAAQTLQPTALVHEVWMRLSSGGNVSWKNRAHFFGAAAQAMRRILVDRSRRRNAFKRRPDAVDPNVLDAVCVGPGKHILIIDECLDRLTAEDPEAARIVMLKFFSGLASAEIASMTGISVRSVERRWTMAKARLYEMIRDEGFSPSSAN